jgi:hypothetical protein
MSSLATNFHTEIRTPEQNNRQKQGPVLLRNRRNAVVDPITRRVTAIVDRQLENGNLPA